jgi:hypothetical protein
MKKNVFRITALMAAMMMTMMSSAKTQDWGGRVIDEKGEPNVVWFVTELCKISHISGSFCNYS